MIMIPFPFLLAEFVLFVVLCGRFGFFPVLAAYWIPSILGLIVLNLQSRAALVDVQTRMARGQQPGFALLNTAAKFIAGLALLPPLFSTRVLGVLLLLPGTRQLLLLIAQGWLMKKAAQNGGFRTFTFGSMGPQGFRGGFGSSAGGFREEVREEREVIDITPLEISERSKLPGDESSPGPR